MKELIEKLKNSPDFIQFEKWVIGEVNKLDTVEDLEGMSDKRAGQEAKIRSLSKNKLIQILTPFINFSEKKAVSEEQLKEAKDKARL